MDKILFVVRQKLSDLHVGPLQQRLERTAQDPFQHQEWHLC